MIGKRLGPYEVVDRLGAGGMGEVYRARDTRLRRDVALKVLPPDVSDDPARRARFEQEAHAAAALSHPNVISIHDVGTEAGVFYMTTELVTGETLGAVIDRGPIPIRTLLEIAVQIADGMASAHAAGIVHRDLKPANIMIAAGGRVKVLDFGLAKQTAVGADVGETRLFERTEPGMILGTASYMSPEQARGAAADYRSDQFSFGLVLYEMATGRQPFARAESIQTMAAIISEEAPPVDTRVPPPLRWIIERCLAKDPAGRYESSRDLCRELASIRDHLSEISTHGQGAVTMAAASSGTARRWRIPAVAALGAAIALGILTLRPGPALLDQSSYRFTPFSFEPGGQSGAVWSPDGRAVAYAARQQTREPHQLYVRYLDAPTGVQLTHLSTSVFPVAWSPDSRRVFLLIGEPEPALWSVATVGGDPELVMPLPEDLRVTPDPGSVTVSPDARSLAVVRRPGVWISSPLGTPLKLYAPAPYETEMAYNQPRIRFSPDGRHLLLLINAGRRGEEAWLLPFPADTGTPPRMVLESLPQFGGTPTFHWLPDSRHIVASLQPSPGASRQLWMADTAGDRMHAITSGTTGKLSPSISSDGTRLVFEEESGHYDVISVDLATATPRTWIATERNDLMPDWAAAEGALVYVTDRSGPQEIWLHRPGVPDRPLVTARDFPDGETQWFMGPALSPKADRVIYSRIETGNVARLWISSVAGGMPIPLTNDSASETPGSWSPDGGWFVYPAGREAGITLMKVRTGGQAGPVVLQEAASANGVPAWSPAGDWIAFGDHLISADGKTTRSLGGRGSPHYMFSRDGRGLYGVRTEHDRQVLFSVDIRTGAEKVLGAFSNDFRPGSSLGPSIRFSLSPDGKSFVYGSGRFKRNLWMLEGIAAPKRPFASFLR